MRFRIPPRTGDVTTTMIYRFRSDESIFRKKNNGPTISFGFSAVSGHCDGAALGLPTDQISPGQFRFQDSCTFLSDVKCPGLGRIKPLLPQQLPLQQLVGIFFL